MPGAQILRAAGRLSVDAPSPSPPASRPRSEAPGAAPDQSAEGLRRSALPRRLFAGLLHRAAGLPGRARLLDGRELPRRRRPSRSQNYIDIAQQHVRQVELRPRDRAVALCFRDDRVPGAWCSPTRSCSRSSTCCRRGCSGWCCCSRSRRSGPATSCASSPGRSCSPSAASSTPRCRRRARGLQQAVLNTQTATRIGLIHYLAPIIIVILLSRSTSIDRDLIEAARDLGATRWQTFRRVILPLSRVGIVLALSLRHHHQLRRRAVRLAPRRRRRASRCSARCRCSRT